ncbi:MAG: glycoside hydrolase family 3 C-terminal domain-containing protein [Halanaerobiaceae bacterium]
MSVINDSIEVLPFRNTELSLDLRVEDLINRLRLEEKIRFIPTKQAAVERLGIKAYSVGGEAAHGWVSRDGDKATVFPQPIGLACSWNKDLMYDIGSVIGDEARIYHQKKNTGLTLWAPTVDMERDPRWGRTEEAYGEDPCLTAKMAGNLVRGMQGSDPFYLKMAAALKHFFANNNEAERCFCSVSIDPRNMKEYYWKPFKSIIENARASCIMTAYNEINGTPAILNKDVKNIVKGEWGLPGFVVGDGGDFSQTVTMHHYYDNHAESIADTLKSGIDCIPDDPELIIKAIEEALEQNLLSENDIDNALRNIFRIRFRLGEFDPDELNPYANIDDSLLCSKKHNELALKAAQESIVLLKNDNNTLPLNKNSLDKVAVIGPLGDILYRDWYTGELPYEVTPLDGIKKKLKKKEITFTDVTDKVAIKSLANNQYIYPAKKGILTTGDYKFKEEYLYDFTDWGWGRNTLKSHFNDKYITIDDGIKASADQVYGWFVRELYDFELQRDGSYLIKTWNGQYLYTDTETNELKITDKPARDNSYKFLKNTVKRGIDEAVEAAKGADMAIVFLGNHPLINGKEEIDREDITLPPAQEELLKAVYKANPNTVLVTISSYPIALNWAEEHIPAIIYSSHAGQETGNAIADVLFGDYNPAGRLSMTWYKSIEQLPDIMDYDIIKGKRTYMYFDQEPLFPFGHGLTYTQFKYSNLRLNTRKLSLESKLEIKLNVKNIGSVKSDEVIQLYVNTEKSRVKRPLKELKDFKKTNLEPGESKEITFILTADDFAYWDVSRNKFCIEKSFYNIMIGRSSNDIRLKDKIEIDGEFIPPRDLSIVTEAQSYDDYQGVILDEIKEYQYNHGGSCVRFINKGDWIAFFNVNFDKDFSKFEMLAASDFENLTIEVRLASPDGILLTRCELAPKKNKRWQESSSIIANINGIHDLYIKATGNLRLRHFRFI